jgi:hypothetical protein
LARSIDIYAQVRALTGHPHTDDDEFEFRIDQLLPTALDQLGRLIASDRARRKELRVTPPFALEVVDGEASLATLLAAPYRLLLEFLPQADVRDDNDRRLFYLARDRYDLEQPLQYGYFTFEGNTFMAREAGDEPGTSDFTAAISANFSPSLDEVVASCVPDLVLLIARMMMPAAEGKKNGKA